MEQNNFHSRLREARKALKMTQGYVSEQTGISRTDLSRYENGITETPPVKYFAFSASSGVDMNYLFTGKDVSASKEGSKGVDSMELMLNMREIMTKQSKFIDDLMKRVEKLESQNKKEEK